MRWLKFGFCLVATYLLAGCAALSTEPTARVDRSMETELPDYTGPRAKATVSKFSWKADKKEAGVTEGLQDMLTTLLVQSKRFRVVERQEFGVIKDEIALGESGYIGKGEGAEKGNVKGADILVVAAITGWEPEAEKTEAGLGGLIPQAKILAGLKGSIKKSSMAMDIRIIDASTSEVLAATRVEGEAKEVGLGGLVGVFSSVPLGGGLSKYSKTPMEKAVRVCMKEAIKYIIENTPKEYFKY